MEPAFPFPSLQTLNPFFKLRPVNRKLITFLERCREIVVVTNTTLSKNLNQQNLFVCNSGISLRVRSI